MRLYNDAPDDVNQRLWELASRHHPLVAKAEVTIDLRMVMEDTELPMPCLKHQGYSAIAIASVTPLKRRAQGASDALIEIDRVVWDDLTEAEQDAVLDHELAHLVVRTKEDTGEVLRDGVGRPKLRVRLHDHQYGWFREVAERHRANSQEVQQFVAFYDDHGQGWFAFAKDRLKAVAGRGRRTKARTDGDFKAEIHRAFHHAALLAPSENGPAKKTNKRKEPR